MTDRAAEALARALVTAFAEFDGNRPGVILLPPGMAERALAALSPVARLAIAGITAESLERAMKIAQPLHSPSGPPFPERVLAALATPGTPEGGER